MLTQLADISKWKARAEKRVFELGYPNRDTGRTGRVTTLSFSLFRPRWSRQDTGAAEANSLRQPGWPQQGSRCSWAGTWTPRSDFLGFFDPWTETSKTPCSFLKARQKQQTPSTESRHNLGLEETLRRNVGQRGGIYIHGRWRHCLYRNDPTKSDFIKHRNVFSLIFIFFVFVPKMDGWCCFSFHLNIHV